MAQTDWDARFLKLAELVSTWSKDPSTKTGSVIVDEDNRLISIGFNGFPRCVKDDQRIHDRELKYEMIIHGEINAILFANRSLVGCTLYTFPFLPCSRCAAIITQIKIGRVVAPIMSSEIEARWGQSVALGRLLFAEANIVVEEIE